MATSELAQRLVSARTKASQLGEQSRALTEAAQQAFDTAIRLQRRGKREIVAHRPYGASNPTEPEAEAPQHLRTFELEGLIDEVPVKAASLDGVLLCDPLLRAHAEVVVALGESLSDGMFPRGERARLDGSPAVMLATLMRAVRVTKLRVGFGGGGSSQV